jgi:cation transport regulator ChaB
MVKQYRSTDELPRLVHRILGTNYEVLGLFRCVVNGELEKGSTQAEAFTSAWEWVKDVYDKP